MQVTYLFPHRLRGKPNYDFNEKIEQAFTIAKEALKYKKEVLAGNSILKANGKKPSYNFLLSTKKLKDRGVSYDKIGSTAACSIVKKYIGSKTIKHIRNITIPIPHKNGMHENFTHKDKRLTINVKIWDLVKGRGSNRKKLSFIFNPGRKYIKICQLEFTPSHVHVVVLVPIAKPNHKAHYLGVDLNASHHIAVVSDLFTGSVYKFDKRSANTRKKYKKKIAKCQKAGDTQTLAKIGSRVKRITRDADHKMSFEIVQLAKKKNAALVLEGITGIRSAAKKSSGKRGLNFTINSWSFYRLRQFIEYKAKLYGVKVIVVDPAYTSKMCSRCGVVKKKRDLSNLKHFQCKNKRCKHVDHADANAGFNIAKRGQDYFLEEAGKNLELWYIKLLNAANALKAKRRRERLEENVET